MAMLSKPLKLNFRFRRFSIINLLLLFSVGFLLSVSIAYYNSLKKRTQIKFKSDKEAASAPQTPVISQTLTPYDSKKEVVAFLPSWILAKNSNLYTDGLTQIIYFGLQVNPDGSIVKFKEDKTTVLEWAYFNSGKLTALPEGLPENTKVSLTLTNFDKEEIDLLISSLAAVNRFTADSAALIGKYNLDGINIDFEYVTKTDFPTAKYFIFAISVPCRF